MQAECGQTARRARAGCGQGEGMERVQATGAACEQGAGRVQSVGKGAGSRAQSADKVQAGCGQGTGRMQ